MRVWRPPSAGRLPPKSVDTDRHPASVSTAGFNRPAAQKIFAASPVYGQNVPAMGSRLATWQLWMQPKEAIKREINKSDGLKYR
jgi:hypothetical protein